MINTKTAMEKTYNKLGLLFLSPWNNSHLSVAQFIHVFMLGSSFSIDTNILRENCWIIFIVPVPPFLYFFKWVKMKIGN
jgi:hypothetical protein